MWHERLLFKLEHNRGEDNFLSLLRRYLHRRKQRVLVNGEMSNLEVIESGVPQAPDLVPLLFLINELEKGIKSQIRFFGDDTMILSVVEDPIAQLLI